MSEEQHGPVVQHAEAVCGELGKLMGALQSGQCHGIVLAWRDRENATYVIEGGTLSICILMDELNAKLDSVTKGIGERPQPGDKSH